MTTLDDRPAQYAAKIDEAITSGRVAHLFDLQSPTYATRGGTFAEDIYPAFHRLRETGPVHEGVVGPLVGYHGEAWFEGLPYPELPHYSVFDWATCDRVFRDGEHFVSHPPGESDSLIDRTLVLMDGDRHRRHRSLVQPSFMPRQVEWWMRNWVRVTIDALCDRLEGRDGADLNVEFFAPIPLLTICGSFGVDVPEAMDIRAAVTSDGLGLAKFEEIVRPIVAVRREEPSDDLISVLLAAELIDTDGTRHVLDDEEVLHFAFVLLATGSGTTWKQMGITMLTLLERPQWLDAVRADPTVLRPIIEEILRWMPTDPVFARFAAMDLELGGVAIPKDAVVHMCLGAANRDPARWERPDDFDPTRPFQPHLGFGGGQHICLGMHVAKAELTAAITTLVTRFTGLRLDPDAEPPHIIGMYERGPSAVPVIW